MNNFDLLKENDLVDNPTARVPVCLCLDVSGSMVGQPIEELNRGVRLFYDAIREDETALYSAEVCIVTFGGKVQCITDFSRLEFQPEAPTLTVSGYTPMGEAVNMALDLLETRKKKYQDCGDDYFQPWLVLMTDGEPNGDTDELNRAIARTSDMVNRGKLIVMPIGIGEKADMAALKKFSPKNNPAKLQGLKFKEFFAWLSKSVSKTSQSTPGERISLDPITGWGTLEFQ